MPQALALHSYLNSEMIPQANQPWLVYLLLEARPHGDPGQGDSVVNIVLVVDVSASMRIPILTQAQFHELASQGLVREVVVDSTPVWQFEQVPPGLVQTAPCSLDFVVQGLTAATERLTNRDRFALVAFASQARVLLSSQPGDQRGQIQQVATRLNQTELGDETVMARGIALGLEQAQSGAAGRQSGRVDRLVVLTDGFTLDQAECLGLARQAAQQGISISTLGLGAEFNEELLIAIAEASGGNAHLITAPSEIPTAFEKEIRGVQSIAIRNVELKVRLSGGVELRRIWRVQPVIADLGGIPLVDQGFSLELGDVEGTTPLAVLLELLVAPKPPGLYRLAQAVLAYDLPAQGLSGPKVRQDITVRVVPGVLPGSLPQNPQVMNVVEKVSVHRLQTQALADAAAGDVAGATRKLRAAATRLLDMGESELATATAQEADRLEQEGRISPAITKKLRYETRKLTQKLET